MPTTRNTPHHRKLALWSALPPYLGGKRRLCPLIFREVDRILPRRLWRGLTFLDGFLGGGSVSLYAKAQGFRVVATRHRRTSIVVGQALIENSRVRLTHEDVLRLAAPTDDSAGPDRAELRPSTFTRAQARLLDRALDRAARHRDPAKAALLRLLAIRVALLAHPMSQVRAGTIHRLSTGEYESITESCLYHYVDGLRLTRPEKLWELAQQINAGVFEGKATVLQAERARDAPRDPGRRRLLRSAVPRRHELREGVPGHRRDPGGAVAGPTSPFTARDGAAMLDTLFERATHIPVWLLSLGNAVVGIEELEAKMTRLGSADPLHRDQVRAPAGRGHRGEEGDEPGVPGRRLGSETP